jgi:hypothetical protein
MDEERGEELLIGVCDVLIWRIAAGGEDEDEYFVARRRDFDLDCQDLPRLSLEERKLTR